MWVKIIIAIIVIISFAGTIAEIDRNKEGSMHIAGICIAGMLALAVVVTFS